MNNELRQKVITSVQQLLAGAKLETNKFEWKAKWYGFNCKNSSNIEIDKYEFCKDICGIANSYGIEDGFIVIGVDERNLGLLPTDIADSGFTQDQIKNLIYSNIDKPVAIDIDYVEVNGIRLSVVHIPVSLDKPHLVSRFITKRGHEQENVIFIRSASASSNANKGQIETMFWERKNSLIERKVEVSILKGSVAFSRLVDDMILMHIGLSIENRGSRPLAISNLRILLSIPANPFGESEILFDMGLEGKSIGLVPKFDFLEKEFPLSRVFSNRSERQLNNFTKWLNDNVRHLAFKHIVLVLTNGEEIVS